MTINYYDDVDGEKIKYKAVIDEERINAIYDYNFEKYSNRREVSFHSNKDLVLPITEKYIFENIHVEKIGNEFEISYTLYDNPIICRIIKGLLSQETFAQSYSELKKLLLSVKQEKMEKIRKNIDKEFRFFNIMLDTKKDHCESLLFKIYMYSNEIRNICAFDSELVSQANDVFETINVSQINEKNKVYNKKIMRK